MKVTRVSTYTIEMDEDDAQVLDSLLAGVQLQSMDANWHPRAVETNLAERIRHGFTEVTIRA